MVFQFALLVYQAGHVWIWHGMILTMILQMIVLILSGFVRACAN